MEMIKKHLRQARASLETGQNESARLALLSILQIAPNHPTALLMLGGVYFHEHKYAEAEMAYARLISAEPGSGILSIALFNCLWNQRRHADALAEIRRFIAVADRIAEHATLAQYAEIIKGLAAQKYG